MSDTGSETVAIIIECKNTRELLREKGAEIKLLEHKINFFFGSLVGFLPGFRC